MNRPYALIIAGGRGERLGGVRKGDLRIGGVRLIDRVAKRLTDVASPLLVSTGHGPGLNLLFDGVEISDLDARSAGPLAGIAAAIAFLANQSIQSGLLVSVAVDTPFLPANYVERLQAGLGDGDAAYAAWGENFYPTNAIWRIEALAGLPRRLLDGAAPKGPKALLKELGGRRVDWTENAAEDPFANLNGLGDLLALGRRASAS